MELSGRVRILEVCGFGVWLVEAAAGDLSLLGEAQSRTLGRSIIGLRRFRISDEDKLLEFQLSDADLLSLGDSDDCIAVAFEMPATGAHIKREIVKSANVEGSTEASLAQEFRSGDSAFISACRSEDMPESVMGLIQKFLEKIRQFSNDTLQEGKHRKWVTYPKNFLALTIQNRNKQFCVHVKKTANLDKLSAVLDIRDDRPGYVRFWLKNDSQLEAAVEAARGSFNLYR